MDVKQVYSLVNDITGEILGEQSVLNEDLSNVVEIGDTLIQNGELDNYAHALIDRIGKTVFVDRKYSGMMPSIMMDGWEFGSVLQKIDVDLPEASENESWELVDGASYDVNVYHAPTVHALYFNKKLTFEVEMSFTERQLKESFISGASLNAFISMIYTAIENAMTIRMGGLAQRAINNMIGLTMYDEYQSTTVFNNASHVKAVNLLKEYNDISGGSLTAADCLTNKEFVRYASYRMGLYADRMSKMSSAFNVGLKPRFTPSERLTFIALSEFFNAAKVYLYSDTFNEEFVKLPNADVIPYWQGSGTDYGFASTSAIKCTTTDNKTMEMTGILAVMADKYSVAVCNQDRRVTSNFNARGEFYNNYYKYDCELINDTNENFVVFFVA